MDSKREICRNSEKAVDKDKIFCVTLSESFINGNPEVSMKYRVIIEQDEDGMFVAEVPVLPGCISQGKTREEAVKNIQEAIELYLESLKAHDEPIPPSIDEEIVEVKQ